MIPKEKIERGARRRREVVRKEVAEEVKFKRKTTSGAAEKKEWRRRGSDSMMPQTQRNPKNKHGFEGTRQMND